MGVQAALLCDYAQVREGLLFVASGGVARLGCASFPAPLNLHVAAIVVIEPDQFGRVHEVTITVAHDGGGTVAGQAVAAFQAPNEQPGLMPGEPLVAPLVVPLLPVRVTQAGPHDVRVSMDGEPPTMLNLYVHQEPFRSPGNSG